MIVGLFIKNYKVYQGIKFVPVSFGDNFSAYFGENGVGKSSILEALDTFFNGREWNINKSGTGGISYVNKPYIVPVFLIEKTILGNKTKDEKKLYELTEKISEYVWNLNSIQNTSSEAKDFISYKKILKTKISNIDKYFILPIGIREGYIEDPYFAVFQHESDFLQLFDIEKDTVEEKQKERTQAEDDAISSYFRNTGNYLEYIRSLYYYLYIPSDIDVVTYTKLESADMQKLMNKNIKNEIQKAVTQDKLDEINDALDKYVDEISEKLKNYTYEKPKSGKSKITMLDFVNRIIKSYFSIRVLTKKESSKIPVNNLSSGEKRKALIDVAYAFLDEDSQHDRKIILAIDEPEVSLHISSCYEQFEKLKYISSKNHQVLITTHWYGFLPVVSKGMAHSLSNMGTDKLFSSFSLEKYQEEIITHARHNKGELPNDIYLKGKYDFIQSIIASLRVEPAYNYILVEGSSDKIYLEAYLQKFCEKNNLRIMPLGGCGEIVSVMKHLYVALDDKKAVFYGKVLALIDTDEDCVRIENYQDTTNLFFRRIRFNKDKDDIVLEKFNSSKTSPATEIEDVLEPKIFINVLKEFVDKNDEYSFISNLNDDAHCSYNAIDYTDKQRVLIKSLFNEPEMKVNFAKRYIECDINISKCRLIKDVCDVLQLNSDDSIENDATIILNSDDNKADYDAKEKKRVVVVKRRPSSK